MNINFANFDAVEMGHVGDYQSLPLFEFDCYVYNAEARYFQHWIIRAETHRDACRFAAQNFGEDGDDRNITVACGRPFEVGQAIMRKHKTVWGRMLAFLRAHGEGKL